MTSKRVRVLLAVVLLSPALAGAEVYRWVDAQGVTHYSDQPTDKARAVKVKPSASGGVQADDTAEPGDEPAADEDDTGDAARVRAEQCGKARQRLARLRDAEQVLVKEEDGGQRELSPDEQVKAIVRSENRVESLCDDVAGPDNGG